MSFNGVKDDLIYLSTMVPYTFKIKDNLYEMKYFNDSMHISLQDSDNSWVIEENRLYGIWDYIRTHSVFSSSEVSETEKLVYEVLLSAGYLSKIKLFNSKTECMEDGYQINAGLGRVLAFKEE